MATKSKKWILGSHNSLSYKTPIKWWMRPLAFMARCQKADLYDQYYKYGARVFDIRVRFEKRGCIEFAHGFFTYGGWIYGTLTELNSYAASTKEKIYVRIMLEQNHKSEDQQFQDYKFKELCKGIEEYKYPKLTNIIFFGGARKYDEKKLYTFKTESKAPTLDHKYSSATSFFKSKSRFLAILDDWFPWLYARTHNKKNIAAGTKKDCLFIDFVNIR